MLRTTLSLFMSILLMVSTSASQIQKPSQDSSWTKWSKAQLDSMMALVRADIAAEERPTQVDSSFLSPGELKDGWRVFRDTTIGIWFRYDRDSDFPSTPYLEHHVTNDIMKWKSFSSKRFGLRFKYPPELDLRVERRENPEQEDCDSSQAIILGFQSADSSLGFVGLVTIHFTKSPFVKIARSENFEPAESESAGDLTPRFDTKVDSIKWDILGRQGMREQASVLTGKPWTGLRGHNYTGIYYKGGGYAGLVDFSAAFLMRERVGQCSIVCKFYHGPTGDVERPDSTSSVEDEPPLEMNEATFYRILGTMELISN
jgi:hypothetical protein